jgi:hypothetical protein
VSSYAAKRKLRWIETQCTNPKCRAIDEALSDILRGGHVPECDLCGSPMEFEPGDLNDDSA